MLRSILLACLVVPVSLGLAVQRPSLEVTITSPAAGDVVFGEATVTASVAPAGAIVSVVFWVDGRAVMELTSPPFQTTVDVGQENVGHVFRVVARGEDGTAVEDTVETRAIPVNDRVTVELQQLYVTVTKDGHRLLDLKKGDFTVYDEGRKQDIATFARGDVPLTAVVLLDSSLSMEGPPLQAAREGASVFFNGMNPLDEGKLLVFSDRMRLATPFTTVPEVLLAGLARLSASGGTALNDNLYLALKLLEERQGRRVAVILSDGVDCHSVLSMKDVLVKARQSQALIYWIRLENTRLQANPRRAELLFSPWRDGAWFKRQLRLLEDTVVEGGGRVVSVDRIGQIPSAFQEVLHELREQYVLGYEPTNQRNDGRWRRIEVKVDRSGAKVLARDGYLDM